MLSTNASYSVTDPIYCTTSSGNTDRVRLVIYVSTVLVLKGLGSAILNVHMSVLTRWVTYKAAKYLLYSIFISSLVPTEFSSSLLIP